MSWLDKLKNALKVRESGSDLTPRQVLNFTGSGVSVADDPVALQSTVTITAGSGVPNTQVTVKAAATTNIAKTGTQTIDGVALGAGDTVLLTGQTAKSENGPWTVASGSWARTADVLVSGLLIFVQFGAAGAKTLYQLVTGGAIVPDSTPLQFERPHEINVRYLGVRADGTDQATAFNAAAAIAAAAKVKLILPSGTHVLGAKYSHPNGLNLEGVGPDSILSFTDHTAHGVELDNLTGGSIRKLKIAGTSKRAIALMGSSNVTIESVEATGGVGTTSVDTHSAGIWIQGSLDFKLLDVYCHDNGTAVSPSGGPSGAEILLEVGTVFGSGATGTGSQTIDGTRTRIAQTFTLASPGYVSQWSARLATNSVLACTVRIETDSAGSPSGVLANANLATSHTFTGTGVEGSFFTGITKLAAGTYWLVFSRTSGSGTFDGAASGTADQVKSYNGAWGLEADDNITSTVGSPNRGEIRGAKLRCVTSDFAFLGFDCQGVQIHGFDIDQGNILGGGADVDSSGYGIAMYDTDLHVTQNVIGPGIVRNCAGSGIYYNGLGSTTATFSPSPQAVITGCVVVNAAQQESDGLLQVAGIATNAPGCVISDFVIDTCGAQGAGVSWQGRGTVISGGTIRNVLGRAALLARVGTSDQNCDGSVISGVAVENCIAGLDTYPSTLNNLVCTGLRVDCESVAGSFGIRLQSATNCTISGFAIENCGAQGIVIAAGSDNIVGPGVVHDCSKDTDNTAQGVVVASTHTLVMGVRSYGTRQIYGIQSTGADCQVVACDAKGNHGGTRATAIIISGSRSHAVGCVVDETGVFANQPGNLNADDLALYDSTGTQLWGHLSYTDRALEIDSAISGGTLSLIATGTGQLITLTATLDVKLLSASGALVFEADGGSHQSVFRSASGSGGNAIIVTHPHAGDCSLDTDAATTKMTIAHHGAEKLAATASLTRLVNATKNQIESATNAFAFPAFSGLDALTITLDGSNNIIIATGASYTGAFMKLSGLPSTAGVVIADTADKLGFFGHTPASKSAAYSVANPTTDRALDVTGDNLAQGLAVLGTLIADLQALGLIG
jgi:parallel beta-helix repeat protein